MTRVAQKSRTGFTLVELAIVLAIVGVLAAGLWRLIAGSNQQQTNLSAANQQIQLINAVKAYLASSGGQKYLIENGACAGTADGSTGLKFCDSNAWNLALPATGDTCSTGDFCNFLPTGFVKTTTNAFGQTYYIHVLRDGTAPGTAPNTYSFMILANGGSIIPDSSGGAISSQIGGDGGFVYTNNVCTTSNPDKMACGSFSNWLSAMSTYGFSSSYSGSIASRTFISPQLNSIDPWLARKVIDSNFSSNTMQTNMFLANGNSINLGPYSGAPPSVNAAAGTLNLAGGFLVGNANIDTAGTFLSVGSSNTGGLNLQYSGVTPLSPVTSPLLSITSNCTSLPGTLDTTLNSSGCAEPALYVFGDVELQGRIFGATSLSLTNSDFRLKRDIHPLNNSLADLMRIKPVTYTMRQTDEKSMGVIAQNLEKVYPELVVEYKGYKNVNYVGLIAPLLDSVQQLKRENDQLRQRLDHIQAELDRQKSSTH